jgi:hypothetical protein
MSQSESLRTQAQQCRTPPRSCDTEPTRHMLVEMADEVDAKAETFSDPRLKRTHRPHEADLIQVGARSFHMPTVKDRAERRDRHSAEVEASQAELRKSISETERLVNQSDQMLRRHRNECEAGDARAEEQMERSPAGK